MSGLGNQKIIAAFRRSSIKERKRKIQRGTGKGGIMSEDNGGFLPLPKNIPKNYLKLSYPVHGNDKVLVKIN